MSNAETLNQYIKELFDYWNGKNDDFEPTSDAFADEYWMIVLALADNNSTVNIARQRDMSKITK